MKEVSDGGIVLWPRILCFITLKTRAARMGQWKGLVLVVNIGTILLKYFCDIPYSHIKYILKEDDAKVVTCNFKILFNNFIEDYANINLILT